MLIGVVVGSQVMMFTLMILRHQPVYDWLDHRVWYYPLPYQAVLLFGLALLVGRLVSRDTRRALAVNIVLILLIAGNVTSWRDHRVTLLRAPWFPTVYYQSAALKASLRARRPASDLNKSFQGFYEYCARRMPQAAPAVR